MGYIDDLKIFRPKEYVEGVTVVHTGFYFTIYRPSTYKIEDVEFYDSHGNRGYTNCEPEEADEIIKELAEEGITAIVGPKLPARGKRGKIIPNPCDFVGIYIVKPPVKKKGKK